MEVMFFLFGFYLLTRLISITRLDISAGNVTFTCHSLLNDEDDDLLDLVSEVYTANPLPDKVLPPHLPKQLVQTLKWTNWEDETEEDIRLVDWGSAFLVGETLPVEAMAQPIDLRSPETFFIGKFDYRHDIWRAGCVMFVLFYQKPPFFVFLPDSYFYMLRMREKLGPLPESWIPKLAELRKESVYAEREGELKRSSNIPALTSKIKALNLTFDYRRTRGS